MNIKKLSLLSILTALAILMSYVEFLIPIPLPIPGIKLGLANIVSVFALYKLSAKDAIIVTLIRVLISSILFNIGGIIYSISGAVLSLAVMILLKKLSVFSQNGVSIAGAVSHNAAQIAVAAVLMNTSGIYYYLPILAVTGVISGLLIGILASVVLQYINTEKFISK